MGFSDDTSETGSGITLVAFHALVIASARVRLAISAASFSKKMSVFCLSMAS